MQKQKWSEKGKKDQQKRRVDAEERVKIQGRKNSRRLLMKTKKGLSIQGRRKQKQKQKTWSRDAGEEPNTGRKEHQNSSSDAKKSEDKWKKRRAEVERIRRRKTWEDTGKKE